MAKTIETEKLFPEMEAAKFLVDEDIEAYVRSSRLIAKEHFDNDCLQGCSYDIRVGDKAVLGGKGKHFDLTSEEALELEPGGYAGVVSLERITLPPNIFARLGAKRKFSYLGLILLSGQTIDPGYSGHLVFGVYNASPKKRFIRRGDKICTAVFMLVGKEPKKQASVDPHLTKGGFPPDFLKALDELDVLPYVELSERISQLNKIQSEIAKLQERYNDVFGPIRTLQQSVEKLTEDVKGNADQITALTRNVDVVAGSVKSLAERHSEATDRFAIYETDMRSQKVLTSGLKWAVGAIGSLILAIVSILIGKYIL
ncbi:MAG: hypothetical protein Q7R41_09270 [Phycisphaerales bacterium]|nr:hypothetical protein [Phycisphaerales bacterium]